MSIETQYDLQALKEIGKIVSLARNKMVENIREGITTKELDEIGNCVLESYGATSAPKKERNFPGYTCISINDEIAHGVPNNRSLKIGDIVNVDVSAELDGYFADTGETVVVREKSNFTNRLCDASKEALYQGIKAAYAGNKLNRIGKEIHNVAKKYGYGVIRNLTGHGIGRKLHEEPDYILNYLDIWDKRILNDGLVLAVETFLTTGAEYVIEDRDGWTLRTPDKSVGAQFEHTIIVTNGEPVILTL
ncbi:MAG: type I methionyl aminopeptidase [Clostridia bacterium]|nr:type I methionyl aminopeptidase [Clostridia bacterium]